MAKEIRAIQLAKALRKQACENYPDGCRKCGAKKNCGSKIEHLAADELELLLYLHQMDLQEIVRLRRMMEAREEEPDA